MQRKTKNQFLSYSSDWKAVMALKVYDRHQHFHWYPSDSQLTLALILRWKSSKVLLHTEMARLSLIFSGKKQSDPITWCLSKVRSWIWCFSSPQFRWYPFRNRYEPNAKTDKDPLKVVKILQFRHILKITTWLKCGFSLLKPRMWPGILRDVEISTR